MSKRNSQHVKQSALKYLKKSDIAGYLQIEDIEDIVWLVLFHDDSHVANHLTMSFRWGSSWDAPHDWISVVGTWSKNIKHALACRNRLPS